MGVESYLVLWVFTDECCHPNRFRVELMLIESFEIGRLDFPNRDTLKSTHCFLPNVPAHRRRASDVRLSTAARSRRSVQPVCWAFFSVSSKMMTDRSTPWERIIFSSFLRNPQRRRTR